MVDYSIELFEILQPGLAYLHCDVVSCVSELNRLIQISSK
jgi:hypothetical protein